MFSGRVWQGRTVRFTGFQLVHDAAAARVRAGRDRGLAILPPQWTSPVTDTRTITTARPAMNPRSSAKPITGDIRMGVYTGKHAVITGGASGLGLGIAEFLVERGARVVITGRSQERLDAAREKLGANALTVRGDVASLEDLDSLAEQVLAEFGSLDALFVNAGITRTAPLEEMTEKAYDEVFDVNVKGAYFTVQKLARLLNRGAGVVLTTSAANVMGIPTTSAYAAGKAALRSLARSFAAELTSREIRVNAISPGPIDTGVLEKEMSPEAAAEFIAQRVAENPLRRLGTPVEIATAAAFLAFDATYTTGVELAVDGGYTQL
ncbi:SDR family NAD(P)-dependent oxidoreductase [Umezawaea beigongshangensis]|uniref:SDR family NAD(P)-dependent oxidoreductase n=1 Tax=Umezawaea beigongshangensis TaxID=2780383 RepID=UPI001E2A7984|nr:glucose 1-dehydrogenase [Umezawaea beigongshangensis]